MRLTVDELRASVVAVAADVATAYARFDPPFDGDTLGERFSQLPGVHPAVAGRLVAAYNAVSDEFGDGGKATVLIACGITRAALDRLPAEGRGNLPTAVDMATARPAEWVENAASGLETPEDVLRAAATAGGNRTDIGEAVVDALWQAGPRGITHITTGEPTAAPEFRRFSDDAGEEPEVTVTVSGRTAAETRELELRTIAALHSAVAAIASGVVPGGGVAYALAAQSLREECGDDTNTGLSALAVVAGLEAPLRARAVTTNPEELLAALHQAPEQAFDQTLPGLVPTAAGPLDAARIVQGVIREAGRAACDLLRLAL